MSGTPSNPGSDSNNTSNINPSRNGPPNYHRLERLGKGSFATVGFSSLIQKACCLWFFHVPSSRTRLWAHSHHMYLPPSQVYRAVHVETNQEAAVKHISQEKLTLKLQENLESEISILKNHSHRNIVRLYDIEVGRYVCACLREREPIDGGESKMLGSDIRTNILCAPISSAMTNTFTSSWSTAVGEICNGLSKVNQVRNVSVKRQPSISCVIWPLGWSSWMIATWYVSNSFSFQ